MALPEFWGKFWLLWKDFWKLKKFYYVVPENYVEVSGKTDFLCDLIRSSCMLLKQATFEGPCLCN